MKLNINSIKEKKNNEKIVMLTAYDYLFAKLFDKRVDIILVGDSLAMTFSGHKDTLAIDLDTMIYHAKAVCKGACNTFIVFDMPFGTYADKKSALKNAIRVYKETDVDAIKIEGGLELVPIIEYLSSRGIAIMGHIGLRPQNVRFEGGYKVKNELDSKRLITEAKSLQKAGCFSLVLEGIKASVAKQISISIAIPTIGIGAGGDLDGQVLVHSDMLGLFEDFSPKFLKKYLNGSDMVKKAIDEFRKDVITNKFPESVHEY